MSPVPAARCPRCGSPDAGRAMAGGLCPACLITTALAEDNEPCPYRVLAPMDEDAAGITYLAQSLNGRRGHVALKVHERHDDVESALSRYERWKPALASVQHRSIARLLDVGLTAEGFLYVATEYVAGWPMSALRLHADVDRDARAAIARQMADAIAAVHAAGVAHLKLDAAKVRISTANGPHASILGLGVGLVVDGAEPNPEPDLLAVSRLCRDFGLEADPTPNVGSGFRNSGPGR